MRYMCGGVDARPCDLDFVMRVLFVFVHALLFSGFDFSIILNFSSGYESGKSRSKLVIIFVDFFSFCFNFDNLSSSFVTIINNQ